MNRGLGYTCLTLALLGIAILVLGLRSTDYPPLVLVMTGVGVLLFGSEGTRRLRGGQVD